MPTLQSLFAKADRAVIRVGAWITFFGVVWSTMTWIASSIPVIVPYGWGVAVFAGLGAACVLSLVMSAGLVSWRYFHPIAPNPAASTSKADPTRVRHEADTRAVYVARILADLRQLETDHCIGFGIICYNVGRESLRLRQILGNASLIYHRQSVALPPPHIDIEYSKRSASPKSEFTASLIQMIPGDYVKPLAESLHSGQTIEFSFSDLRLEFEDEEGSTEQAELWHGITVAFTTERPVISRVVIETSGVTTSRSTTERI